MYIARLRPFGQKYAFVVVAVVFLSLLAAAGLRATPGVLILPLEQSFGWSRDAISLAAAIGIFLYGLVGPFAAALMQSFGIKRTLVTALLLLSASTAASSLMSEPWQFMLTWGVLTGLGSGCVAIVLGATIVNRWFVTNRRLGDGRNPDDRLLPHLPAVFHRRCPHGRGERLTGTRTTPVNGEHCLVTARNPQRDDGLLPPDALR